MNIPNPSLSDFKGGGAPDAKKLLFILLFLGVGFLVFLGDRVCFNRIPESLWESLVAYPTSWGYLIFKDRFFADGFAFCLWAGGMGTLVYFLMSQIEERWIEPMMVRKTVRQLEREKKWMNQYGKDLF
ncbi:MAG: hypothetical protein V4507_10410 [Verrucomicrobiota bacterium]